MTKQLEGEELAIAAAKAMGWSIYEHLGTCYGEGRTDEHEPPTEWEIVFHLTRMGRVKLDIADGACDAGFRYYSGRVNTIRATGACMVTALRRLVVAVAAREAKA